MDNSPDKLRVAIIGGGIGGLALALTLSKTDLDKKIEVDIYEAAPELTQVGAGISIWPRPWEILKKLGIDEDLAKVLPKYPDREPRLSFKFRKSDEENGIPFGETFMKGGMVSFHRAEMQTAFLKEVSQSYRRHLSHRLISYKETEKEIALHFQNGSVATCDVLVGADGIKSVVRKGFITEKSPDETQSIEPVWSGTVAYRGLYESSILAGKNPDHSVLTTPMMYCGKNKHIVTYPISQNRLVNIVAFCSQPEKEGTVVSGPTVVDVSKEELWDQFGTWEADVRVLLEGIEQPSRWAIQTVQPLKIYASGLVALVGDSAHAMTPHLGVGAGIAIEDGYILGTILSIAARDRLPVRRALEIYTNVCQPVGNFVSSSARMTGRLYEFNAPGFEDIRENGNVPIERLEKMISEVDVRFRWVDDTSAEDSLNKVLELLRTS